MEPTTDIFTGMNDTDILAMQQETKNHLDNFFGNQPKQFTNPNDIEQPHVPKGMYGTVSPGENINLDKTSTDYNNAFYSSLVQKSAKQYPDSFKQLPDIILPEEQTHRYTNQSFGFDVSRDNEDFYNRQQNGAWEFFGKSLFGRLPLLTLSKLGTGVGYLFGLANPANWFEKNTISAAGDNMFAKFFEGMEDKVKNDWLPIYQKASARNMGFFERAFKDQTFWSGDITDAAAFMASAFIPGFAASKLSLGAKLATGLGMGDAIGTAGEYLANGAGRLARNFDVGLTTAANTASESMFEAKQVRDDVYKQLMSTGKYTDQEAQNIAGDRARNSFLSNLAALSLSNLWESNLIFKAMGKGAPEGAAKIEVGSLLEDYKVPKESKLGFYGKKALQGVGVEGFYEENIQQAIQRYNEQGDNKGKNPLSYAAGVLNQMYHQTIDALKGKDRENAMNIGVGALIGGLFGTGTEILGKEYSKEHTNSKNIVDVLNQAKNNWLKIQDIYSVGEDGKLKTDYQKAASILITQGANVANMKDIESIKDDSLRNVLQKQLFASLVNAHVSNGSFSKLINQLDDMKTWKSEDLAKLGFDPDSKEGASLKIEEYKNYAQTLKDNKAYIDKNLKETKDSGLNEFRRNQLYSAAALRDALVHEKSKLLSTELPAIEAKIGNRDVSDPLVHQANTLRLQMESQKAVIDNTKTETGKERAEKSLTNLQQLYDSLIKKNEDSFNDLKKDKDGYFYYRNEEKRDHPMIGQLHELEIKEAQLSNSIADVSQDFRDYLNNDNYTREKYDKQIDDFNKQIVEQQKETEKQNEQTEAQQPVGKQIPTEPINENQKKVQELRTIRDAALKNATTPEAIKLINERYVQDVLALNKSTQQPVAQKTPEQQFERFEELKKVVPRNTDIKVDEYNKLGILINKEADQGNINSEHQNSLLDRLSANNITSTIFDKNEAESEEGEEVSKEELPIDEDNVIENYIESQEEKSTEENPEIGTQDQEFNPDTNDIQDDNLEGDVFSYLAYKSSNKTITQEEKTDENGNYSRQLDEDPYKQFKQNYLRFLNTQGIPEGGLHAKIIRDNDSLPHSEETKQYLASDNPYGSVLVLTNEDGNTLYFDDNYNSSAEPKEGYQPLVYSFNSINWRKNDALRAIIGENRTGKSYDDFIKQYDTEEDQQKLARLLNIQGKEVPVMIKAVTPGVSSKSKNPNKASDIVTDDFNTSLFIPPSPVDRFDPTDPLKNRYVLVANKALINGGLYAQVIDKNNNTSYVRLLPNRIIEIPQIYDNIVGLLSHEFEDRNQAEIAKDYLKSVLFLGTPKRPNVITSVKGDNFIISIVQNNIVLDEEAAAIFVENERFNVKRTAIDSNNFDNLVIKDGKLEIETVNDYKSFILQNSTTRDLPLRTEEGNKFIDINNYAIFDFMDSLDSMKENLRKKEGTPPGERIMRFDENQISVWRHAKNSEDRQGLNSGKNDVDLDEEGIEEAKELGERWKRIGVKQVYSSDILRAYRTADIASEISGAKFKDERGNRLTDKDLRTWDIGDFTSKPDAQFDEIYFATNPKEKIKDGKELKESFETFKNRALRAYEKYKNDPKIKDQIATIITHSRVIRIWDAYKENGEQWDDRAVERYLNLPGNFAFTSVTKQEAKESSENLTKSSLKRLGTIKSAEDEAARLAREQDEKDKQRGLKAKVDTRENRGLLKESEREDVNRIFGHEVAQRIDDIVNSDARALWTLSGIKLYRDAREGDGYHEAWHHFSQLYLNQQEKKNLYNEVRRKAINFVDRDNNKVNTKDATDLQVEEFMADDFRDYVESDGKSRLAERPQRNNIFRKILDFIKKFFFGDTDFNKLYDNLYKGNLNHYTPSINNAMWGKLNSRALNQKGEEIVNNQKAAYYRGVVDYFMGSQLIKAKTSVDQLRKNKKLAEAIYKNIYNDLVTQYFNPMIEAQDKGQPINQIVVEDLYKILSNWEDFVQYHKKESKLFVNIPGELAIDVPENPEDYTEQTEQGGDLYEINEYNEEFIDDTAEEIDAGFSDKIFDIAGNEHSSLEAASIETKGLIRMLPEMKVQDDNFVIATDVNGFPKLCDYAKTWNNLALELSNIGTYEEMYNKLQDKDVMKKIPEIFTLLQHLPDPAKDHTPAEIKTIVAFRTDFNRAYIGIYSGSIVPHGDGNSTYYFNEETKRNRDQIGKSWTANFNNKLNTDPNVKTGNILLDEETGKYYLNLTKFLAYNMSTVTGREAFLNLLGFKFSEETKKDRFYTQILPQLAKSIQDNINKRHENGQRIYNPVSDLRGPLMDNENNILAPGLRGTITGMLSVEAKFSSDIPSLSYQTAEGEMIYALSLNHTLSIISNKLNRAKSYNDVVNSPELQHLNFINNPYVKNSIFLEGLFNKDTGARTRNQIIVGNYNGLKGEDRDGNTVGYSTTNLNVRQKAIFDINSLLSRGAVEVMRTESSKSAYFIKLDFYNPDQTDPSRGWLPVGISEFTNSFSSPRFVKIMTNYLSDELSRMKYADDVEVYKKDPKLMAEAKSFNLFRTILSYYKSSEKTDEGLKDALKKDVDNMHPDDVINKHNNAIQAAILNYFNYELRSFKDLLKEENITGNDIGKNILGQSFDQRIRAFIANDFILNIEYAKLYNGDTIYQAHYKDYFKRSKGDISTGKTPITDELFAREMRKTERNTFAGFINSLVQNNYKTTRTINFVDDERGSKYVEIYKKDLKAINPKLTDAELDKYTGKYNNLNIGDGQGWITLDFYRQFLKSINNWSDNQEMMYKVELTKWRLAHAQFNPEYTNEMKERDREFLQQNPQTFSYFPPLKIQYNGPIEAKGTYAPVMDKFSVAPLIPSIIQNTPLEDVHNEMLKHGVGYAKFTSGTKKYKAPAYSLYNENGFSGVDLSKADLSTHFLDYLKEQINTSPKIKQETIFGSQVRKLIEANIFSNGNASAKDLERHERYKSFIKGMIDLGKEELYKDLSLKEEGGKLFIDNVEKFISTLQTQADARDLNDNIKDYIQYDKDTGKMMFPLETSLNRPAIQDLVMGIIDRKLRLQKLSGDQLIQISSSGFQSKDFKYRNATDEEIKKYGTNGLRFYHLQYDRDGKPIRTRSAQVKVALTGSFEKLLFKNHPDGKRIGTIERLNELLKNEDWTNENRKSITMVGYRIPTQGHNSIEHLEVAEFLPSHAGSVVIVPAEIVAKAGSDFDIDKLSVFKPSFDDNGELIGNKSKEGYANKIIGLFSEILEDPATFEKLIRPNDTDLVKPVINEIAVDIGKRNKRDIADPQPYKGTQIYRYKSNLRKFETLLSAKKLLAIFAVNNTFTTLMQQAGITTGQSYQLSNTNIIRSIRHLLLSPQERQKIIINDRINMGSKYSVDGTLKQDYLNQLINATVDAASDDFFGYVNASFENVNVLCHLINQGVPFARAMRFLNQPVLLRYYSDLRRKDVFQSKDDVKALILSELTGENYYKELEDGRIMLDRKGKYHPAINKILNTELAQKIFLSEQTLKKYTVKGSEVDDFLKDDSAKIYNSLVFAYFISLQEQAQLFRNFQTQLNFDTSKVRSPIAVWQAFDAINNLKVNQMFDANEYQKMIDKSVIAPFDNRKLIATIAYQMMPVGFHPWFTRQVVPMINSQTQFKNKTIQKKIIKNIENQWIEYSVKSLSRVDDGALQLVGKYLLEGKNNIARRFNDLISKYPSLKEDYAFVNRIRPNFSNREDIKKSNIEISRLFENSTDDQNRYISEFRELINLNNPLKYSPIEEKEIRKFFKDLAIVGFVQSGFTKSNISFQELVPYEELADVFKTALKNMNTYVSKDENLMKAFVREFIQQFNNNNGDRNIQKWRGRDYYLSSKIAEEIAKKAGKINIIKSQVQTQSLPAPYENTVKTKEGDSGIKSISIQMQPDNIEKILKGIKTTTTRSQSQVNQIGLEPGDFGKVTFGNKEFLVRYRGMQTINEAGGKEAILKSEGVNSIKDFKFQQTKDWFNGKGKLGVYEILDPNKTIAQVKQEGLLQPEVKTDRQYWPGEEVGENKSEFEQALGKAEFKLMMDQLSNYEPEFYDVFDTYKGKDNAFIVTDEYTAERITSENFERFWKLYEKFGDDVLIDYNDLDELVKDLKSITNDNFDKIYPSLTKALEAYQNNEISEENLPLVEKELSEYGLLRYKNIDEFNPNQLKLFTDEDYEKMLKDCK